MRITNKMLSHSFLRDMSLNLKNMQTLQQQMTSGKEIRRPSDDPFKVSRAMQLHTDIDANKQYNENIKDTINWLDTTDTALGQAGDVLQRIRELIVSSGNAAYGNDEKKAIKDEINQKVGELSQILNTNFDGKYVFGGSRGATKPLNVQENNLGNTNLVYNGRDSEALDMSDPINDSIELDMIAKRLPVEISQGVTMEYNVPASDLISFSIKRTNKDTNLIEDVNLDLMDIFENITSHLDGMNPDGTENLNAASQLTEDDLIDITDVINNLLRIRSEVGSKQNRMESALDKNTEENFNMTEILSKTEDIDITEKTMQYATMQTVYTASLQTSAKVLQPSLLDYLR